jgi:hypothetical protein
MFYEYILVKNQLQIAKYDSEKKKKLQKTSFYGLEKRRCRECKRLEGDRGWVRKKKRLYCREGRGRERKEEGAQREKLKIWG